VKLKHEKIHNNIARYDKTVNHTNMMHHQKLRKEEK